jgi:hypothetical protein
VGVEPVTNFFRLLPTKSRLGLQTQTKNDFCIVVAVTMAQHEVITQSNTGAESFMTQFHRVLLFCKAATVGHVALTLCSPYEVIHVQAWDQSLHIKCIMYCAFSFDGSHGSGPLDPMIKQVSATMFNMVATLSIQYNFIVTQSKKKLLGFTKLGSYDKKLILLASSPDANYKAVELVPAYEIFMGITSIGGACDQPKNELKAAHGVEFIPSSALTVDWCVYVVPVRSPIAHNISLLR